MFIRYHAREIWDWILMLPYRNIFIQLPDPGKPWPLKRFVFDRFVCPALAAFMVYITYDVLTYRLPPQQNRLAATVLLVCTILVLCGRCGNGWYKYRRSSNWIKPSETTA